MTLKNISGIILSGGKSSRMGTDKALLKLGDESIISRVIKTLKSVFVNVFIISDRLSDYEFLDIPTYQDFFKQRGPLSGIHSALVHSKTDNNLIISCDLPLISAEMIKFLLEYKSNKPIKYFYASNKHQYLPGVFSKSIVSEIEKIFLLSNESYSNKEPKLSIKNLIDNVGAETISPDGLSFYFPEMFMNINTPADYEILLKFIKQGTANKNHI